MTTYFETSDIIHTSSDGIDLVTNDILFVDTGVTVAGANTGEFGALSEDGGITVNVLGTLWGGDSGITFVGGNNNIVIGTTGSVVGILDAAISLGGSNDTVTNSGDVSSSFNLGIFFAGSDSRVINTGLVSSNGNGVAFEGSGAGGGNIVTNSGTIGSIADAAIWMETSSGATDAIDNSGTLETTSASQIAIQEIGAGTLDLSNSGQILGDVSLGGDGAAASITNQGTVEGSLILDTASGATDTIYNSGTVVTNVASMYAIGEAGTGTMDVTNKGDVSGTRGIDFDGASGTDMLDNSGTIKGPNAAVYESGAAALDVTNSGHIIGNIVGVNIYDGTLGNVTGQVTGTGGNNTLTGGAGSDHFDGGTGNDVLDGMGGNDVLMAEGPQATIDGGDGNDTINMASFFNASDQIDGGAGRDTLLLDGDYSAGLVLGISTLVNVEKIVLSDGFKYVLTTDDATVAAGAALTVDASAMTGGNTLNFNGSAETDGHFVISGSAGNDVIVGGAGNDVLTGNGGNNLFTGGLGADHIVTIGGHDHFIYNDVSESTGLAHDVITNFSATTGKFDLDVTVTGINTAIASGRLSTANFDANLTSAVGSAQLGAGHAVLFTPTIGNLAGHTYLIVDANGVAGYQAGQDYVFELVGATHLTSLATTDFI